MNANELADYLEKAFYADEDISKAANMLRQLQAENELLRAKLNYMFEQELKTARLNK